MHTLPEHRDTNTYCTQTHTRQTVPLIFTTTAVRLGTLGPFGLLHHLGVTTLITLSGNPQTPTDTHYQSNRTQI